MESFELRVRLKGRLVLLREAVVEADVLRAL